MKQFAPSICKTAWSRVAALFFGIGILSLAPQAFAQSAPPETLTNASIIAMKNKNLDKELIITKINLYACNFSTDDNALSELQNAHVDKDIIKEMMKKASPSATPAVAAPKVTLAPKEEWGTLKKGEGKDKKKYVCYISEKGRTFKLGDTIQLGRPTRIDNKYAFIRKSWALSRNTFNDKGELLSASISGSFVIMGIDKSGGMFDPGDVKYLYIKIPGMGDHEITIEAALKSGEIE